MCQRAQYRQGGDALSVIRAMHNNNNSDYGNKRKNGAEGEAMADVTLHY